jgi:leucyl-tRNA synthetase
VPADISEKEAKEKAFASDIIKKWLRGEPKKIIFVKGKLINIVV